MGPQTHFLLPFFIAFILFRLNIISFKLMLLCAFLGVLIDLDHYIEHILHSRKHKFSLAGAWNNSVKLHKFHQRSFIHHEKGALILTVIFLALAFFYWKTALILAISYYSHIFLDWMHLKGVPSVSFRVWKIYDQRSYFEIMLDILLAACIGLMIIF